MPLLCPHVTPSTPAEAVLTGCPCVPGLMNLAVSACLSSCSAHTAFPKSRVKDFQTPWETTDPRLLSAERSKDHLPARMHASNRPQAQSQPSSLNKIRARDAPVLHLIKEKNKLRRNLSGEKEISLAFMWAGCRLIRISDLWCTAFDLFSLIIPYNCFLARHYFLYKVYPFHRCLSYSNIFFRTWFKTDDPTAQ